MADTINTRNLLTGIAVVATLLLTSTVNAQTVLSDNFNRPDGVVGNGWSSWWSNQLEHPNTSLVNGELRTYGSNSYAGGIFQPLPIKFPIVFSFDFRTLNEASECNPGLPFNDGGWLIVFNGAASPTLPPFPPNTPAQIFSTSTPAQGTLGEAI
jgi:hypothetical protein